MATNVIVIRTKTYIRLLRMLPELLSRSEDTDAKLLDSLYTTFENEASNVSEQHPKADQRYSRYERTTW